MIVNSSICHETEHWQVHSSPILLNQYRLLLPIDDLYVSFNLLSLLTICYLQLISIHFIQTVNRAYGRNTELVSLYQTRAKQMEMVCMVRHPRSRTTVI